MLFVAVLFTCCVAVLVWNVEGWKNVCVDGSYGSSSSSNVNLDLSAWLQSRLLWCLNNWSMSEQFTMFSYGVPLSMN